MSEHETTSVLARIDRIVQQYPVVLFMKGSAEMPLSANCKRVVDTLVDNNIAFHVVDITQDPEIRAFLPRFTNESHVPQLYVAQEWLGGAEVITELANQGDLSSVCEQAMAHAYSLSA